MLVCGLGNDCIWNAFLKYCGYGVGIASTGPWKAALKYL